MNLKLANLPTILFGGAFGAGVFFLMSFFVPIGSLGEFELTLTIQQSALIFGSLAGMIGSIVVIVVKDSYHPETGVAGNFSEIHGTGSMFIGKSEVQIDGSYLTTEWFCMLLIPIFPVCNYRVVYSKERSTLFGKSYTIKEKHPVRAQDLPKGYLRTLAFAFAAGMACWYLG
jgi:hypothetical protein